MSSSPQPDPNNETLLGIPANLARLAIVLCFATAVIFLLNLHSECWFSVSCHPDMTSVTTGDPGYDISVLVVSLLTTTLLTTTLSVSFPPAMAAGVVVWMVLRYWL